MKITMILEKNRAQSENMFRKGLWCERIDRSWLAHLADALEHLSADRPADEILRIELVEGGDGVGSETLPLTAVGDRHQVEHRQFAEVDKSGRSSRGSCTHDP